MPKHIAAIATGLAWCLSLATACVFPTDRGSELRIEVAPIARMILGDTARVDARLLGADGLPMTNARFAYTSADNSVAVVTPEGLILAVNSGTTNVTVRTIGTARTPTVHLRVAVSAAVSVDSLRPSTAKWGQVLFLYGAGLGPGDTPLVTINGTPVSILSYDPEDARHPERFGALRLLAAPPLRTSPSDSVASVLVSTQHGAGALKALFTVEQVDIFERNTLAPGDLGTISGPREFPGLAMEAATLGPSDIDWYRFTTTAPGDLTIDVRVAALTADDVSLTVFPAGGVEADSYPTPPGLYYPTFVAYYPGSSSSSGQLVLCRGRGGWYNNVFAPGPFDWGLSNSASGRTLTLRNLPAGPHDLLVSWAYSLLQAFDGRTDPHLRPNEWAGIFLGGSNETGPVRYDLVLTPGVQNGLVSSDAYEPNDFCEDAAPLLNLGSAAFADSVVDLTFAGDLDHDWFKVDVQTDGVLYVEYRVEGMLTGVLVPADSDSAVVAEFLRGAPYPCPSPGPRLTHSGPDMCTIDGAPVRPGLYYLLAMRDPPGPVPYQLVFSWAPGALPAGPRARLGR